MCAGFIYSLPSYAILRAGYIISRTGEYNAATMHIDNIASLAIGRTGLVPMAWLVSRDPYPPSRATSSR